MVVGGGIAGLTAAWELGRSTTHDIVLLEASPRPGGKLLTTRCGGALVEEGADAFVATTPDVVDLARSAGLSARLVSPAVFAADLWLDGALRPMPQATLFGVPARPFAAVKTGVLSPRGALQAAAENLTLRPLSGPDLPVATFVEERLGREVLDRLVEPVLAGTRSGRPEDLSLAAALPEVDELARRERSVTKALRSRRSRAQPPAFRSFAGGLGELVEALQTGPFRLRLGSPVTSLQRAGRGYEAVLEDGTGVPAAAAIVAVPAPRAAGILAEAAPRAAEALTGIPFTPAAVLTFAFRSSSVPVPRDRSGVLLPRTQAGVLTAATWYSSKWPGSGPVDVVRAFAGRAGTEEVLSLPDDDLSRQALHELEDMVGRLPEPQAVKVTRWSDGLPQYRIGHRERLHSLEEALLEHPRLALAGASYRGPGITACVASGKRAAARVAAAPARQT